MSNLFDALLKSETEQAGSSDAPHGSVTEVLRRAERRAAEQWKSKPVAHETNGKPHGEAAAVASSAIPLVSNVQEPILLEVCTEHPYPAANTPYPAAANPHAAARTPYPVASTLVMEEQPQALSRLRTIDPTLPPDCRLVSYTDKDSAGAEAFRLLAVRLRHIRKDRQLQKLLITSTVPQEGKSLTSSNLACTLSAGGSQKVLLVEGDIRRPSLTQMFGLSTEPGFCEFLQGRSSLEQSIYRLARLEFWVLPAGRLPNQSLDLIQSPKMPELLERMKTLFDWIIIDSPPVLPLADTSVLARMADGILLVTRRGITEKKLLQRGLDALDNSKLLGTIINSSRKSLKNYYYYGTPAAADFRAAIQTD